MSSRRVPKANAGCCAARVPCVHPGIRPELLEGFKHTGDGKRYLVRTDASQRVVSETLRRVGGVQIEDTLLCLICSIGKYPLDQIAVRIDQCKTSSRSKVLLGEYFQQRGLLTRGACRSCMNLARAVSELPDRRQVRRPSHGYAMALTGSSNIR
jgi:hypothetical protein